jgi:hypothetical protein
MEDLESGVTEKPGDANPSAHARKSDSTSAARSVPCPQCQSTNTVAGTLRSYGHNLSGVFRPKRLKPFSLTMSGGVELFGDFHACADCGTIWGQEDQQRIADFVRRNCT